MTTTPYEMTTALAWCWTVLIIVAIAFAFAAVVLLENKYSHWHKCDWCKTWFTLGGRRQAEPPKSFKGKPGGGHCECCVNSRKAEVQRRNLLHKGQFYPRMDAEGN